MDKKLISKLNTINHNAKLPNYEDLQIVIFALLIGEDPIIKKYAKRAFVRASLVKPNNTRLRKLENKYYLLQKDTTK